MTPDVPGLNAPTAAAPKRKGALLLAAPPAGAPVPELLGWLGVNLRIPSPVARVARWGGTIVSPIVLTLEDGRKIRFEEGGHLNNPSRLVETVATALGSSAPHLPLFTKADAQDVFQIAVRACAAVEVQDGASEAQDWQDGLWHLTSAVHHGDYRDAAARWAALKWLTSHPDFDPAAVRLAHQDARYGIPLVIWADGSAFLRAADVFAYVRGVRRERIDAGRISARLGEAGWKHRTVDTYKPGSGRSRTMDDRVRVKVFEVAEAAAQASPEGVYPSVPLRDDTHARTHTRIDEAGHRGTPPEEPLKAEELTVGDTSTVRDTSTGVPSVAAWAAAT